MSDAEAHQLARDLFRFACVLAEDEPQAAEVVAEAITQCRRKQVASASPRFRRLAFSAVWRALVPRSKRNSMPHRKPSFENGLAAEAPGLLGALPVQEAFEVLRRLPEPGRSALVLLCLGSCDAEDLESILDQPLGELSVNLMLAREELSEALKKQAEAGS